MAPQPVLKKKRGRPSNAEKAVLAANNEVEHLSPEPLKPKRKGRRAIAGQDRPTSYDSREEDELLSPDQSQSKRHARYKDIVRQKDQTRYSEADADELLSPERPKPKNRGRKSSAKQQATVLQDDDAEADELLSPEQPKLKKRGRKSKAELLEIAQLSNQEFKPKKNRKTHEQPSHSTERPAGRNRARQSDIPAHEDVIELEHRAEEQAGRRKRGRPPNSNPVEAVPSDDELESPIGTVRIRRKQAELSNLKPNKIQAQIKKVEKIQGDGLVKKRTRNVDWIKTQPQELPGRKRRKRSETEFGEVGEIPPPKYQHLAVVQRNVPRHTIDAKWTPLPRVGVDIIGQLFQEVERTVVMRFESGRKRDQASTALHTIIQKTLRKLYKLPFPPSTKQQREDDFDFEKIVDSNRVMEARLTPLLHSYELLKAEIERETSLLEADVAEKNYLESNSKKETSRRKQLTKKLHPILRDDTQTGAAEIGMVENLLAQSTAKALLHIYDADDEMKAVMEELHNHLDSIKNNVIQVEGLGPAMVRSRAAVQGVLFEQLDTERFEHVVLG